MALARFPRIEVPLWGEIGTTARAIGASMGRTSAEDQRPEVAMRRKIWREEKARRETKGRGLGVDSASIFAATTRQVPRDAILAVDVGNNTYSFGRYFECDRQSVLMSG